MKIASTAYRVAASAEVDLTALPATGEVVYGSDKQYKKRLKKRVTKLGSLQRLDPPGHVRGEPAGLPGLQFQTTAARAQCVASSAAAAARTVMMNDVDRHQIVDARGRARDCTGESGADIADVRGWEWSSPS